MFHVLLFALIIIIYPTFAYAKEGANERSNQAAFAEIRNWVYSPTNQCPGSEVACNAWVKYRASHPWPYQSFGIAHELSTEEAVIIISEPPPVINRAEMIALVRDAFGTDLIEIEQFRWPTGLDGWLEDTVVRVRVGPDDDLAQVMSGYNFSTWEVPAWIVDRLSYIHFVFHGTSDGFYIDEVNRNAEADLDDALVDIQVTPADIQLWLADDNSAWRSFDPDQHLEPMWGKLRLGNLAGAFESKDHALIAFIAPKKARLNDLAVSFRRFAVSSDLLVTAIQPKNGGLILIGRNRQLPLALLPPLRFETFANFAATPTKGIYQSYERQRLFAGKILDGEYKGWDWAPIYLSAQLDNTEFGTLLNQADQILKSWSESGLVKYKTFDYPLPERFPFDEGPASEYFSERLGSRSLIFNWNTHGFSTITALPFGNVLTAYRAGSLPVLYITGNAPMKSPNKVKGKESIFSRKLQDLFERERKQLEADAGDQAYQYFAEANDPILVRVVQNVFLYQAVTNFLALGDDKKNMVSPVGKSEVASKVIRQEAERWLKVMLGQRTLPEGSPAVKAISDLLHRPGMTQVKLAEYLATPQAATRHLLKIEGERRKLAAQLRSLEGPLIETEVQAIKAFEEYCSAVENNGGRRYKTEIEDQETGEKIPGERCELKARQIPESVQRTGDKYGALQTELTKKERLAAPTQKAYKATAAKVFSMSEEFQMVDEIARIVDEEASFTADLDTILKRILETTRRIPNDSSIQTPAVVLSQNQKEFWAIGGHNIEGIPLRTRISPTIDAPRVEGMPGRSTLIVPAGKLGNVNAFARDVERGTALSALGDSNAAGRDLSATLHIAPDRESVGTLLDTMRSVSNKPFDEGAFLARADNCSCDVYVQREVGEIIHIRKNAPPPPAKFSVLGSGAAVETLARMPKRETVHFAGFEARAVEAMSNSVMITAKRGKSSGPESRVTSLVGSARKLFAQKHVPQEDAVVLDVSRSKGSRMQASVWGDSRSLQTKPNWKTATVSEPPEGPLEWLKKVKYEPSSDGSSTPALVVVRFEKTGERFEIESMGVLAEMPTEKADKATQRLGKIITASKPPFATAGASVGNGILELKNRILKDLGPKEVIFFIQSGVGDVKIVKLQPMADPVMMSDADSGG